MSWPTPQDYNEAIQTPSATFFDEELKRGRPQLDMLGLPRPVSGAFASVYRMHCEKQDWAVRCFLRNVNNQQYRYNELSRFLEESRLPQTVKFDYQEQGIKLKGEVYPLVKMEWVSGKSLDQFVDEHSMNQGLLYKMADYFRNMMSTFRARGIAHGDLQHGNILVVQDGFRLVDYDGTFVSSFHGQHSNELGHPNYQHPMRSAEHFGPALDNFSAWVIYVSLACLSLDPALWGLLRGGDECLLFRQSDYAMPLTSLAFSALEHHANEYIQTCGKILRTLLRFRPDEVPGLDDVVAPASDLPEIAEPGQIVAARERAYNLQIKASDFAGTRAAAPPWPKVELYQELVKQPSMVFKDRELRRAQYTYEFSIGRNGIVFHFKGQHRHLAVKCFFRDNPEREIRYQHIKSALTSNAKNYLLDFEYLREGIQAQGRWLPILKMDWFAGTRLDEYVWGQQQTWVTGTVETDAMHRQQLQKSQSAVQSVLHRFRTMMQSLYSSGIAHGDLSQENILVTAHGMKLVDYDNMFVSSLAGLQSQEFGDPLFQHPARSLNHFAAYLDNYPAWVIDNALTFLVQYPDAYHWSWMDIVQFARSDVALFSASIVPPVARPGVTWPIRPEIRRRAQLMHIINQFPVEQVPALITDFGDNVLKREALMNEVNKVLQRYSPR